ncbi:hypothetical protein Dfri01_39160 [Dyadobacter frigoris]|nr:hypothetical protein Dfri01_39160 [Dyadobacter frigoris]
MLVAPSYPISENLNTILVPQQNVEFYEFTFPSDLSCVAGFQRQEKETGSISWIQNITFNLPHMSDGMLMWAAMNGQTRWIVFTEDYNGLARVLGGMHQGLKMSFGATTGESPKGTNPMSFSLTEEQLLPYLTIPSYEDNILFPSTAGFSYGFSTGFNS